MSKSQPRPSYCVKPGRTGCMDNWTHISWEFWTDLMFKHSFQVMHHSPHNSPSQIYSTLHTRSPPFLFFLCFRQSLICVTQDILELLMQVRMNLNFWPSSLHLQNTRIIGMCHQTLFMQCWGLEPRTPCVLGKHSPDWAIPSTSLDSWKEANTTPDECFEYEKFVYSQPKCLWIL